MRERALGPDDSCPVCGVILDKHRRCNGCGVLVGKEHVTVIVEEGMCASCLKHREYWREWLRDGGRLPNREVDSMNRRERRFYDDALDWAFDSPAYNESGSEAR